MSVVLLFLLGVPLPTYFKEKQPASLHVRVDIRIANLSFTEVVEAASWTVERVGRYSSHKGTSVDRDHGRRSKQS